MIDQFPERSFLEASVINTEFAELRWNFHRTKFHLPNVPWLYYLANIHDTQSMDTLQYFKYKIFAIYYAHLCDIYELSRISSTNERLKNLRSQLDCYCANTSRLGGKFVPGVVVCRLPVFSGWINYTGYGGCFKLRFRKVEFLSPRWFLPRDAYRQR